MIISDIQQSVIDLWRFLVPPISILLSMSAITYFIWGHSLVNRLQGLVPQLHYIENPKIERALKFYGLDKLMPLITLFIIIFILHASLTVFYGIGQILPPHLSYDPNELILKISDNDRLARIWAAYPNIKDLSNLRLLIEQKTELEENESLRRLWGIEYWKEEMSSNSNGFRAIKFLILWAVFSLLLSQKLGQVRPYPWARFLKVLLILIIIGIFFIASFFYAVEQSVHAELNGIEVKIGVTTENAKEDWKNSIEQFKQKVQDEREFRASGYWWYIRFMDDDFYKWIYRNI